MRTPTPSPPEAGRDTVCGYYRKILPFYELEAVSHAHLSFWRGVARDASRILEVGSGFGRITAALARGPKARAVGIDLSLEMLSRAVDGGSSARFVAADMRRSPFGRVFDLVIAPSDPISHLTRLADRRRALCEVARQLVPGGRFVLEGLYRKKGPVALTRPRRVRHGGGVLTIEEAWFPAGLRDLWHARYRYVDRRDGGRGKGRSIEASFVARAWPTTGIRELFASCGLAVDALWGDFDGRPFTRSSPRLLVFARTPLR